MSKIYKIVLIFTLIQFSLFSACAESEENNVVKEVNRISVLDKSTTDISFLVAKSDKPLHLFISKDENVEFATQFDYTLKNLLDTFDLRKSKNGYIGKFVSDTILNLLLRNLTPKTDYYISAFHDDSTKTYCGKISTLIQEPNQQTVQVINTKSTDNSVTIRWTTGNGQNRIVVIRKGKIPDDPIEGKEYKPNSTFGSESSKYGNGNFVVYNSKFNNGNELTIENLKYTNYHIKIFEYNGEDKYINYFTENAKMNPIVVQPLPSPPKNLTHNFSSGNTFVVEWEKLDDTIKYELQVAKDKKFENIIKQYDGLFTGNSNKWELPVDLISNNVCYYRVRAIYGNKKSNYSKPEEVKIK